MQENILEMLSARQGHFLLESGHHGDLWLDLETLCRRPHLVQNVAAGLAQSMSSWGIETVCAPLVEGAFVGLMVALELNVQFAYSERYARDGKEGLFPAGYRIPDPLREELRGRRVGIVNDVINAGSAVRGTFADLQECGATVVGIGALLVLGNAASEFASNNRIPLNSVATLPNNLWTVAECPLCLSGVPLQDLGNFRSAFAGQRPGS